ncbi:TetR/AcrR family transcriptional regulator [Sphingobium vermicomposti]|uniref:AcrR family transcriptional regulator n=1 Tax=Sphingobium vermicomposti TaxID=529005 RepID=A0A846M8T6_9SPHN|nr:helix-turn-helix domain-containing protein [Sphingobium vermicomposti]NIJ18239.1 AcrR family transcriptional regulator [Sphingobium vermicomposti]
MSITRLSSADRRASIITAARSVFARYGLEGARTQQIAQAAGVSEALIFRHFSSKIAIYRAVLREVIADQNASFRDFTLPEPSTVGLLRSIGHLMEQALLGRNASNADGMRMVVGSLAGDGGYARLVYRRALRLSQNEMERAMAAARAEGGITGAALSTVNAAAFLEHVGTMVMMGRCHERHAIIYDDDDGRLLRDAIMFCARGLGIVEERITEFLNAMPPQNR